MFFSKQICQIPVKDIFQFALDFILRTAYNKNIQSSSNDSEAAARCRRHSEKGIDIMSELYDSPELLTLEDENGEETVFEILDTMDLDDKTYVALTPYHENPEEMLEGDAELVVLVTETVDGEEFLASIDDDEEYDRVGSIFLERLMAEYDSEEDGED